MLDSMFKSRARLFLSCFTVSWPSLGGSAVDAWLRGRCVTLPSKSRESPISSQSISCIFWQPFQAKAANPPFRLKAFLAFLTTLQSKRHESPILSQGISCIFWQPFQAKAANPPFRLKAFLAFFDNPSKQKARIPHFVSKHFLHFSTTLPSKSRESHTSSQSISCIIRQPFQAKAANPPLCLKAFLAFFDNPSKQKPRIPHFVSKHFLHFPTTLPSKSSANPPFCLKAFLAFFDEGE
jgi:hypothetical protein